MNLDERRVLLAFDGTPASRRALEHVAATESAVTSRVHLLNVQHPTIDDEVYLPEFLRRARLVLREASRYLEARDITHTAEVAVGFPSDVIVSTAKAHASTAIVMGMRSAIARLLSGSVSRRVVREAGVPVTLVKENGDTILLASRP